MNCPKCGEPLVNESGWQCKHLRCPEAHKDTPCRICGELPVELVRINANAGVFRCPNGHEFDLLVE
jgi:hypothetical protein